MYWNHRTVEHRDSSNPDHEVYLTVHETYYDMDEEGQGVSAWATTEASPRTKEEGEKIIRAFDRPPIAWVDDDSLENDENGLEDYKSWGWLEGNHQS